MGIPVDDIEDTMATLLQADSSFDSIARFVKGFLYRVPDVWFPLCEINVWEENKIREQTGNYDIVEYTGDIRFDIPLNDASSTSDRITTVSSSRTLKAYIRAARMVLNDPDNNKLGNLTGSGWAVRYIEVSRNAEYSVDSRSDRENDYQLVGRVPFVVQVQEQNT